MMVRLYGGIMSSSLADALPKIADGSFDTRGWLQLTCMPNDNEFRKIMRALAARRHNKGLRAVVINLHWGIHASYAIVYESHATVVEWNGGKRVVSRDE